MAYFKVVDPVKAIVNVESCHMKRSMSRQAGAERERRARVIAADEVMSGAGLG